MYSTSKRADHQAFLDYWANTNKRLGEAYSYLIPEFFGNFIVDHRDSIYSILKKGKRLRGCLLCLMSEAFGATLKEAIPRAVAIECIHAASLVHDDYVDQDKIRRDRPATWTVEGPRKAVLLGDVIFATAIWKMMEMSPEDGSVIAETIATMAQGAYQEYCEPADLVRTLATGEYRPEIYDLIIHLKTGALFGAVSKIGAIAANAPSVMVSHASDYGVHLGAAYQIIMLPKTWTIFDL